jgi:hypothetical protein
MAFEERKRVTKLFEHIRCNALKEINNITIVSYGSIKFDIIARSTTLSLLPFPFTHPFIHLMLVPIHSRHSSVGSVGG